VNAATELRWILTNCTLPSADFIAIHNTVLPNSRRAKMIVCVLQSRSNDSEAEMFLEALNATTEDRSQKMTAA
jgi:hypothetical protein